MLQRFLAQARVLPLQGSLRLFPRNTATVVRCVLSPFIHKTEAVPAGPHDPSKQETLSKPRLTTTLNMQRQIKLTS